MIRALPVYSSAAVKRTMKSATIDILDCNGGDHGLILEGFVRGSIANPLMLTYHSMKKGKLDVGGGVGQGILSVTHFTGLKDLLLVAVKSFLGNCQNLWKYLYTSEQTPSSVGLGVLVNPDLKVAATVVLSFNYYQMLQKNTYKIRK